MIRIINYTYLIVTIIVLLTSCRENIIAPDDLATNVNEPILMNETNSYTFILNAKNLSIDVTNDANFNSFSSNISITILDYSSGYVSVNIFDKQSISRFNYLGSKEENFFTQSLNGYVLESVGIKTVDFSGKLRIEINRTF